MPRPPAAPTARGPTLVDPSHATRRTAQTPGNPANLARKRSSAQKRSFNTMGECGLATIPIIGHLRYCRSTGEGGATLSATSLAVRQGPNTCARRSAAWDQPSTVSMNGGYWGTHLLGARRAQGRALQFGDRLSKALWSGTKAPKLLGRETVALSNDLEPVCPALRVDVHSEPLACGQQPAVADQHCADHVASRVGS